LVEWELTEKNGGGLGKSPPGYFPMGEMDYPAEKIGDEVGEATAEVPA